MNIQQFYNLVVFILRKERNGFITIDEFNQVIPRSQLDVYDDYYDIYAKTQKVHDALSPFKVTFTYTNATSPGGVVTLPDDYLHLLSANTITLNTAINKPVKNKIRFVTEDELDDATSSQLRPVSVKRAVGINTAGSITLYPSLPMAGEIRYLRKPLTPFYSATVVNRVVTYNPSTSQDLEFSDIYQNKIVAKCLSYMGINLDDDKIFQYSQLKDAES